MKIIVLIIFVSISMIGCVYETQDPKNPDYVITPMILNKRCLDGVTYYSYSNRLAPAFGKDSKVILCNE